MRWVGCPRGGRNKETINSFILFLKKPLSRHPRKKNGEWDYTTWRIKKFIGRRRKGLQAVESIEERTKKARVCQGVAPDHTISTFMKGKKSLG